MEYIHSSGRMMVVTLILWFTVAGICAQEPSIDEDKEVPSSISGKVVDTNGKPIAGFTFIIQPTVIQNGFANPRAPMMLRQHFIHPPNTGNPGAIQRTLTKVETDENGNFSATNIPTGAIQIIPFSESNRINFDRPALNLPPELQHLRIRNVQRGVIINPNESKTKILTIQLNKVTFFYPVQQPPFEMSLFTFGVESGVNLENVKITVEKRLKFRVRIVYADGTPLANSQAELNIRFRGGEFGSGGGNKTIKCSTDAEGYFTHDTDKPGIYILSIKHKTLSGAVGPFILKNDLEPDNLVIKLDGNTEDNRPNLSRIFGGERNSQPINQQKSVWIINPFNGHAYKRINCKNWHHAQRIAIKEGAHLVSINDEEEQFWLEAIFTNDYSYWIGLNDLEKEGEWQWDSGEPVTYFNWTTTNMYNSQSPNTERDYAVISSLDRAWHTVGPNSPLWHRTEHAIIEKDGLVSTIPKTDKIDTDDK